MAGRYPDLAIIGLLGSLVGFGCGTSHFADSSGFDSETDAPVVVRTRDEAPAWTVPYGDEFWRRPALNKPRSTVSPQIDVHDAIDRVSHAITRGDSDSLPRGRDRSYLATFDGYGIRFAPLGSKDLRLRTSLVEAGTRTMYHSGERPVPWSILGNTAQARLNDALIEHHELRVDGAEVSWLLRAPITAGDDLVITASVDGLAYVGQTSDGVHYGEAGVASVTIGNAELVDALGRRWPIATEVADSTLRWRVDASVLASASFPIVVDPTISAEFRVGPKTVGDNQSNPAVATNGSDFLVVWAEYGSTPLSELYGTRVSTTGQIKDVNGIVVSIAANRQERPAVASNGTDYFVAWTDFRNSTATPDIYGARVMSDGTIPPGDVPGIAIATTGDYEQWASVASNGSDYFVAWEADDGTTGIFGARVTSAGQVLDRIPIQSGFETWPATASNGLDYLVSWTHHTSTIDPGPIFVPLWAQFGALVSPSDGTLVVDPIQITGPSRQSQAFSGAASNGTHFLTIWTDRRGGSANIYAARVNADGSVPVADVDGFPLASAATPQDDSSVASNGTDYLVAWADLRDVHLINAIYGVRVTSAGTVPVADAGGFPIAVDTTTANVAPRLAGSATTPYLVAYEVREAIIQIGARLIGFGCGNGVIDSGEGCDDGSTANGDGCSANCQIEPGYTCSGSPSTCADINECATANGGCAQICTNMVGSFACSCGSGYTLDANGHACDDIDECATANGGCAQICTNSVGSFACSCGSGYTLDANGHACDDIDECATANGGCTQTCANSVGSYTCGCAAGYTLDADGHTCHDVDECASDPCSTDPSVMCTNTPGGFSCGACPSGYAGDGRTCTDVDECSAGIANCATDATCTNTRGGFVCSCNAGFQGDGVTCLPNGDSGCGCRSNSPDSAFGLIVVVGLIVRRRRSGA